MRSILHVGQIGRAHGLQGEIRVNALSSDPDRLARMDSCLLVSPDERETRPVVIDRVRQTGSLAIVKLQGIDDRTAAEKLHGWLLSVRRENALALAPDQWFICDLIGCRVEDDEHGHLGQVRDIIQGSAQDVYVVNLAGRPDLLFPALKSIIRKVDLAGRLIVVRLPEGLYEIYRGGKT
jgi:16S rRNA processing protein RimM